MQDPRQPNDEPKRDEPAEVLPTEVESDAPARDPADGSLPDSEIRTTGSSPPAALHEIARAFRMNAEALTTLKQIQGDLARSVQRGDRSELVLQSTRSLNDTFRNLTSVQRELLSRLDGRGRGPGRSPLVPLMILGLLVVVVAGVYLILDAVQESAERPPTQEPALTAQRLLDRWTEGRVEGARQSEREIQRLQDLLAEARGRSSRLEADIDEKQKELSDLDRGKRTAELERDEFASRIRKAQNEMMAKQVLEEEVSSLRRKLDATNRQATDLEVDLERQKRLAAWYRQRLADYGMDIPADDPPYVAPQASPAPAEDATPAKASREPGPPEEKAPPGADTKPRKFPNLATAGGRSEAAGAASDAKPLPTPRADPTVPSRLEPRPPTTVPALPADMPPRVPRKPGELPPPILKPRSTLDRDPVAIQRVRRRINRLLDASAAPDGESWQIGRIDGVARDRLGGVILMHYDASGRMIESVEARDLRITVDRDQRIVEFGLVAGVRVAQNRRTPLPERGIRVTVAKGDAAGVWAGSGLTMVRKR